MPLADENSMTQSTVCSDALFNTGKLCSQVNLNRNDFSVGMEAPLFQTGRLETAEIQK